MTRMCPDCQRHNPTELDTCDCGRQLIKKVRSRTPIYLAAIPLVLPMYFMLQVFMTVPKNDVPNLCAGIYGVALSPTQVLTGTVRNSCENPLSNVHLSVSVVDDRGARRVESIAIHKLGAGQSEHFERVLSGRVRSWEIASDK